MVEFNFEDAVAKAKQIAEELSAKTPEEYMAEANLMKEQRKASLKVGESLTTVGNNGLKVTRTITYGGICCDSFLIPHTMVGYIIGHKGETLRGIEQETHTRIHVEREGGPERSVTIQGKPEDVDRARSKVDGHIDIASQKERQKTRY